MQNEPICRVDMWKRCSPLSLIIFLLKGTNIMRKIIDNQCSMKNLFIEHNKSGIFTTDCCANDCGFMTLTVIDVI